MKNNKIMYIDVDGQRYEFLFACHKCGKIKRRRVIVKIKPNKYERLISYKPITVGMIKEFIREKVSITT
jgi:hypothetical protein